jgi:hypothetical protein
LESYQDGWSPAQNTIYSENFQLGNQVRTEYLIKRAHQSDRDWVDVQDLVKEGDVWHSAWRTWNTTRESEDFGHIRFASHHNGLMKETTADGTVVFPDVVGLDPLSDLETDDNA